MVAVRWLLLLGVIVALIVAAMRMAPQPASPALLPTAVPSPVLSAHGTIEPVGRATIATLHGGILQSLPVRIGQSLDIGQVIAKVNTQEQTEILLAPWRGTVIGLNARLGDTLMPGTSVAIIGDLSRYQVETNDVDEYLISHIFVGQRATITVEALDGRKLEGIIETVALAQQTSIAGVIHYPVVIRLADVDSQLRPGMTVRIVFSPKAISP